MASSKKIIFLSATRAEFGKLKPLFEAIGDDSKYEAHLFVTGMHLLEKYGGTAREVLKELSNVYLYNNQAFGSRLDIVLSNTIYGLSHYVNEIKPDLIVVHGDRAETLAGAIVGSFNNTLVAHIEGGEVSGTIDELIRHSVSKLSHIHFVASEMAKQRLIQMGERKDDIYVIGSPDIDVMYSYNLPSLESVLKHYEIPFKDYAILIYHPVTTEIKGIKKGVFNLVSAIIESRLNYIVIYPNNDPGSDVIIKGYDRFNAYQNFRVFPSIQFEKFLVLLKHCRFIIGNSSAGIREAPVYSRPTINIGSRQKNRFCHHSVFNVCDDKNVILTAINKIKGIAFPFLPSRFFGEGKSAVKFKWALERTDFWQTPIQKQFLDI